MQADGLMFSNERSERFAPAAVEFDPLIGSPRALLGDTLGFSLEGGLGLAPDSTADRGTADSWS